jgi:hypothetical protein
MSLPEPFSERAGEGGSAGVFVHMFAAAASVVDLKFLRISGQLA